MKGRTYDRVVVLGWGTQPLQTIRKLFPCHVLRTTDYIEIGKIYRPFNKPHGRASLWNDGITLAQDGLLYRSKDLRSSAFSRFKYLKPNTGAAI